MRGAEFFCGQGSVKRVSPVISIGKLTIQLFHINLILVQQSLKLFFDSYQQ